LSDDSPEIGTSGSQISRLEQGKRLPDPAAVAALFVPSLGLSGEPEVAETRKQVLLLFLRTASGARWLSLRELVPGSRAPIRSGKGKQHA
jgi:hypothetical protein